MLEALNLEEGGRLLGISAHTLRAWARKGRVTHFKLGRRLVFDRADLEEFLAKNRVDSAKKPAQTPPGKIGRNDPGRRR